MENVKWCHFNTSLLNYIIALKARLIRDAGAICANKQQVSSNYLFFF